MDLCPHCGKDIAAGETICPYCGRDLRPSIIDKLKGKYSCTFIGFAACFGVIFFIILFRSSYLNNRNANATPDYSCIILQIESVASKEFPVKVAGSITNHCKLDILEAEIQTTCFSSSGTELDRELTQVEHISIGGNKNYETLIYATTGVVDKCSSVVTSARRGTIK